MQAEREERQEVPQNVPDEVPPSAPIEDMLSVLDIQPVVASPQDEDDPVAVLLPSTTYASEAYAAAVVEDERQTSVLEASGTMTMEAEKAREKAQRPAGAGEEEQQGLYHKQQELYSEGRAYVTGVPVPFSEAVVEGGYAYLPGDGDEGKGMYGHGEVVPPPGQSLERPWVRRARQEGAAANAKMEAVLSGPAVTNAHMANTRTEAVLQGPAQRNATVSAAQDQAKLAANAHLAEQRKGEVRHALAQATHNAAVSDWKGVQTTHQAPLQLLSEERLAEQDRVDPVEANGGYQAGGYQVAEYVSVYDKAETSASTSSSSEVGGSGGGGVGGGEGYQFTGVADAEYKSVYEYK